MNQKRIALPILIIFSLLLSFTPKSKVEKERAKKFIANSKIEYQKRVKTINSFTREWFDKLENLETLYFSARDGKKWKRIVSNDRYMTNVKIVIMRKVETDPEQVFNFFVNFTSYDYNLDIFIIEEFHKNIEYLEKIRKVTKDREVYGLFIDFVQNRDYKKLLDIVEIALVKRGRVEKEFLKVAEKKLNTLAYSSSGAITLVNMLKGRELKVINRFSSYTFPNIYDKKFLKTLIDENLPNLTYNAKSRLKELELRDKNREKKKSKKSAYQISQEKMKREREERSLALKEIELHIAKMDSLDRINYINSKSADVYSTFNYWLIISILSPILILLLVFVDKVTPTKESSITEESDINNVEEESYSENYQFSENVEEDYYDKKLKDKIRKLAIRGGAATEALRSEQELQLYNSDSYQVAKRILNLVAEKLSRVNNDQLSLMEEAQNLARSENLLDEMRKLTYQKFCMEMDKIKKSGDFDEIDFKEVKIIAKSTIHKGV